MPPGCSYWMFMPPTLEPTGIREAAADPMCPEPYCVTSVSRETHDTFTLSLEPVNGVRATGFAPGQFSMLYVFGVGELPISISGDPEQAGRLTEALEWMVQLHRLENAGR